MNSRLISRSGASPRRHCQMALGSLSTGRISPPQRRASSVSISPATTMGSLFASATCFPACRAASVGSSPALPTIPCTTSSTSACDAISSRLETRRHSGGSSRGAPSSRWKIIGGRNSHACCSSRSRLLHADSPSTSNSSGNVRTTSRVCVPMEPVEPRTTIRFMVRRA